MLLYHEELLLPFLLLAIPTLGVLATGLVRGRLAPAVGLMGIVVMPGSAFTLGNLALMERAKRVEFCASCHEMAPVVRAAFSDGEDLASLHFRAAFPRRQGCYTCHSGYGIWGDVNAKLAGVDHMWATFTNSADYPLRHAGRFDAEGCLKCHADAEGFAAQPAHAAIGQLGCSGTCHPPAHDPRSLGGPMAWPEATLGLEDFR